MTSATEGNTTVLFVRSIKRIKIQLSHSFPRCNVIFHTQSGKTFWLDIHLECPLTVGNFLDKLSH